MILRWTCATLTLACCAMAQTQAREFAPHIFIESAGPDGWRARLGPTNVGVLLASEEGRELWEPVAQPMLDMWSALAGGGEAYREASERLLGYGGTIRVAVRGNRDGPADVAICFDGDGRTDMAPLAADVEQLLEGMTPGPWQEMDVAGTKLRVRRDGNECVTAPMVDGERMIMLLGDAERLGDATRLAAWITARPVTLAVPKPGSPAARMTFDLPALLETMQAEPEAAFLEAMGFTDLRHLTFTLAAAGPRVQLGCDVEIDGPPRGVVKALMPAREGISSLAALLPEQVAATKIARFDVQALVEGIFAAVTLEDEDARAEIEEELGLDLVDDLFVHATDELLVLGAPLADYDRLREATWSLAWRLKDEAKFRAGYEALLNKAKGFLTKSETVDLDGVELRRYGNLTNYDLWMAVGNGVWVISAGRDAEETATDLLRRAKSTDGSAAGKPPARFADLARHLPNGVNGFSFVDLDAFAATPVEWWYELADPGALLIPMLGQRRRVSDGELDATEEAVEKARALLKKNNLSTIRTATGSAGGTWRWRLYW